MLADSPSTPETTSLTELLRQQSKAARLTRGEFINFEQCYDRDRRNDQREREYNKSLLTRIHNGQRELKTSQASLQKENFKLHQTQQLIFERLRMVEESCSRMAASLKRKHDDEEDPGHHEGEKRPRLSSPERATVSQPTTSTEPPAPTGQTKGPTDSEALPSITVDPSPTDLSGVISQRLKDVF